MTWLVHTNSSYRYRFRDKKEDSNNIFELFYTTKAKGSGIGLALTKKMVENHYGYINFKNNEPKGTVFYVLLPIAEDSQQGMITETEKAISIDHDILVSFMMIIKI